MSNFRINVGRFTNRPYETHKDFAFNPHHEIFVSGDCHISSGDIHLRFDSGGSPLSSGDTRLRSLAEFDLVETG
jgi:hypothetical protein